MPFYTGSGWYGYTYKTHLNGAQNYFAEARCAEEADVHRPGASRAAVPLVPPRNAASGTITGCKGIDTGIMREPPVKYWVMGENRWRTADRLAAAGNAMDQALSQQLGAAVEPSRSRRRAPTSSCRRTRSCRCRRRRPMWCRSCAT